MTEWDWKRDHVCSDTRDHCVLTGRAEEELRCGFRQEPSIAFQRVKESWTFLGGCCQGILHIRSCCTQSFGTLFYHLPTVCESGFSALIAMKTKYRYKYKIKPSQDMRVSLSMCCVQRSRPSHQYHLLALKLEVVIKGLAHPKIKSLITHPHAVPTP